MKDPIVILSVVVGIALVAVAMLYFTTPANTLPSFVPGYDVGSSAIHLKHGIGSLVLGLGAFALAWFKSGKKSAQE